MIYPWWWVGGSGPYHTTSLGVKKKTTPIEQWIPVQIYEVENQLHMRNISVFEVKTEEEVYTHIYSSISSYILEHVYS